MHYNQQHSAYNVLYVCTVLLVMQKIINTWRGDAISCVHCGNIHKHNAP